MIVLVASAILSVFWFLYRGLQLFQIPLDKLVRILNIEVPKIPEIFIDNVTDSSIGLHWDNVEGNRIHYILHVNGVQVSVIEDNCCTLDNLVSASLYQIDIISINETNFRSKSISKYVKTLPANIPKQSDHNVLLNLLSQDDEIGRLGNSRIKRLIRARANTVEASSANAKVESADSNATLPLNTDLTEAQIKSITDQERLKILLERSQLDMSYTTDQHESAKQEFTDQKRSLEGQLDHLKDLKRIENEDRYATKTEINLLDVKKTRLTIQRQKYEAKRESMKLHINKMKNQLMTWENNVDNLVEIKASLEAKGPVTKEGLISTRELLKLEIERTTKENSKIDEDTRHIISSRRRVEAQIDDLTPLFRTLLENTEEDGTIKSKGLSALEGMRQIREDWYIEIKQQIDNDSRMEAEWRARQQREVERCIEFYKVHDSIKAANGHSVSPYTNSQPQLPNPNIQQPSPFQSQGSNQSLAQSYPALAAQLQQPLQQNQNQGQSQQGPLQQQVPQSSHQRAISNVFGATLGSNYYQSPHSSQNDSPVYANAILSQTASIWGNQTSDPSSPVKNNDYLPQHTDSQFEDSVDEQFMPMLPADLSEELNVHRANNTNLPSTNTQGADNYTYSNNFQSFNSSNIFSNFTSRNDASNTDLVGFPNNNIPIRSHQNSITEFSIGAPLFTQLSNDTAFHSVNSPQQSFAVPAIPHDRGFQINNSSPHLYEDKLAAPFGLTSGSVSENTSLFQNQQPDSGLRHDTNHIQSALSPKKLTNLFARKRSGSSKQSKFFSSKKDGNELVVESGNDIAGRTRAGSFGSMVSSETPYSIWSDNHSFLTDVHDKNTTTIPKANDQTGGLDFLNNWSASQPSHNFVNSDIQQHDPVPSVVISATSHESISSNGRSDNEKDRETNSVDSRHSIFAITKKSTLSLFSSDKDKDKERVSNFPPSPQRSSDRSDRSDKSFGQHSDVADETIVEDEVVEEFHPINAKPKLFNLKGLTRRTSQGSNASLNTSVASHTSTSSSEKIASSPSKRRFSFFTKKSEKEEEVSQKTDSPLVTITSADE